MTTPCVINENSEHLVPRQLFGGAVELHLPARFSDVSDARPVPDHQEEYSAVDDSTVGRFLFEDLSNANTAASCSIESVVPLGHSDVPGAPEECYKTLVTGRQLVSKGREGIVASNEVQILLAAIRMPNVNTDVLIMLNTPVYISPQSAAAEHAGSGLKDVHFNAAALLAAILKTFKIHDWELFGPP